MRIVVGSLIVLCVVGGVMAHRKQAAPAAVVASNPATQPAPAASPVRQPSWPKSSIDRANEVKAQVLAQRKADGN